MSNVKGVFERKFLGSLIYVKCMAVFERTFLSPVENGPQNGGFWSKRGEKLNLVLRPPKGTSLRGTTSFDVFCVKIRAGVLAVDYLKNPQKTNK